MERKHCERCNSWVPVTKDRCPNCLAPLSSLPPSPPIQIGPDGALLKAYVGEQLDGVTDPNERMARLLGVKREIERAIETGAVTDYREMADARDYLRWIDEQAGPYLETVRQANLEQSVPTLWWGAAITVVGVLLAIAAYLAAGSGTLLAVCAGVIVFGVIVIGFGISLRVRPPALPQPSLRAISSAAPAPAAA
jgi:hypothetical protein